MYCKQCGSEKPNDQKTLCDKCRKDNRKYVMRKYLVRKQIKKCNEKLYRLQKELMSYED